MSHQHTNKRGLSCSIFTKHYYDLRVRELTLNHFKFETTLCFRHSWVFIACICFNFFSTLLWCLSYLFPHRL
ncbi:hypothetical protein HanXRQr2_Chr07g0286861 [Helianthus annuus]|uniref:Uncharacterized protein n=1 Tax=Helianthus annuus TaxID=4232 RepID=A0A9K3NEW1_HELAN|nr:hypothetical protein HanXRQr2_Chr07g0286861 [Helianthus annuus]